MANRSGRNASASAPKATAVVQKQAETPLEAVVDAAPSTEQGVGAVITQALSDTTGDLLGSVSDGESSDEMKSDKVELDAAESDADLLTSVKQMVDGEFAAETVVDVPDEVDQPVVLGEFDIQVQNNYRKDIYEPATKTNMVMGVVTTIICGSESLNVRAKRNIEQLAKLKGSKDALVILND